VAEMPERRAFKQSEREIEGHRGGNIEWFQASKSLGKKRAQKVVLGSRQSIVLSRGQPRGKPIWPRKGVRSEASVAQNTR